MQISMQHISAATAVWFVGACGQDGQTRGALARGLCEAENWRGPTGGFCTASARKVLPRLATALKVCLPEPKPTAFGEGFPSVAGIADVSVQRPLAELGDWSLHRVVERSDRQRWEAMMATHHPTGWNRAPGGQVRYWLRSEAFGILGGLGFAAASLQVGPRDQWIGWSADARVANIGRVISNHRF